MSQAKIFDESWWQKDTVDHQGAKDDGYEAAIIRGSHGFIKDEYFLPNAQKARDADQVVGTYCYLYVNRGMQMEPFAEQIDAAGGIRIPAVLDVERYSNESATVTQWRDCIDNNVAYLEDHDFEVGFYTSHYMWQLLTNNMSIINGKPAESYMLFVAHWANVQEPLLPYPWKTWEFWQKGSNLVPSWAQGRIDYGVANMTTAELREKYLGEEPPPEEPHTHEQMLTIMLDNKRRLDAIKSVL